LEYCKIRNTAKAETRKAVREYEKEIAKLSKKNPKAFYRHVNSKLKTRTGMSDLKDNNGASISDDKQKAELFNDFFGTMYTLDDQQSMPDKPNLNVTQYLSNIEFVKTEVLNLLQKLQTEKSPGPDRIHPCVLKECALELAGPLTTLFQASMMEGELPEEWKEAVVTPVFKKRISI